MGALPKTELIVTAVKQLDEIKKDELPKIPNAKEGFSVSAGALYVKPMTNGDYGLQDKINYVPGFQVSADYQAKNNWDYGLKFKHFQSTTNYKPEYPVLQTDATDNGQYKINYNVLDLEIGKRLVLSDNTSLRLSGGLRTAIMNEKTDYTSTFVDPYSSYRYASSSSYTPDFWGIGPRITGEPTWKPFGNNFRVFGNVAGSFLMGQSNASWSSSYSSSYSDYSSSSSSKRDGFVTMLEAGSGLGYTIKSNSADIDLKAGYQLEHWITDIQADNNLNFNGYQGAYGTVAVKY